MFDFTICQIRVYMFNTYIFISVIINLEYILCRKKSINVIRCYMLIVICANKIYFFISTLLNIEDRKYRNHKDCQIRQKLEEYIRRSKLH